MGEEDVWLKIAWDSKVRVRKSKKMINEKLEREF
jgi:hypothetical protein